jgi:hypothetical protein
MTGIIILYTILLVAYIFLRSHGGKGFSINAKLPSSSTPEGKKARMASLAILFLLLAATVYAVVGSKIDRSGQITMIAVFIVGSLIILVPNLKSKK